MVHIKITIPHQSMLLKTKYQCGKVKNILSFPPVHRNASANWGKRYIYILKSVSIFSVLWRIYSRLYRDKNVEFHKLMSMSSSVLTETTANSKKSSIFLNFQYCKWKNKYTNKLYFSLKTIQFEMSAFL